MDDYRYRRSEDDPRIDAAVERADKRLRGKVTSPLLRAGIWLGLIVVALV